MVDFRLVAHLFEDAFDFLFHFVHSLKCEVVRKVKGQSSFEVMLSYTLWANIFERSNWIIMCVMISS